MTMFARMAAVLAAALIAVPAVASTAAAAPGDGPAYIRLAHLSPDTPDVDVYLASVADPALRVVVPGVGYGDVSDYRVLSPGGYTVSMRPAGAAAGTPPMLSTTLDTRAGAAYTVAGVGPYRRVGLTVLDDDLTMPPPGQARVRVINAAATAPRVDVTAVGAGELATALEFATSGGYRPVPAGGWTLGVRTSGGSAPLTLPIRVAPNAVYTVLLVDGPQGLTAQLHADSAGAVSVPRGAVETGFGPRPPAFGPGAAWVVVLVAAVGVVVTVSRRRARGRSG